RTIPYHALLFFFFFQAEDGIRDRNVTGVQTCALPIFRSVRCLDLSHRLRRGCCDLLSAHDDPRLRCPTQAAEGGMGARHRARHRHDPLPRLRRLAQCAAAGRLDRVSRLRRAAPVNAISDLLGALGTISTSPTLLLVILLGVILGTVAGLLPGVGPSTAIALLLPVAITVPPELSLPLMVSLYLGAEYGGRISAILLNIPGDPGAIM